MFVELGVFVALIFVFILSIFFHELAHLFVLSKITGRNPKLKIIRKGIFFEVHAGESVDYMGLTDKEAEKIYLAGIIAGLVVIWVGAQFFAFGAWLLLFPYLWISKSDIKEILAIWKNG